MKNKMILVALLGLFVMSLEASAKKTSGLASLGANFKTIDTNGDRAISFDELRVIIDQRFKNADVNKDGQVSYEEVLQAVKARFDERDLNEDGVIEPSEAIKFRLSN